MTSMLDRVDESWDPATAGVRLMALPSETFVLKCDTTRLDRAASSRVVDLVPHL